MDGVGHFVNVSTDPEAHAVQGYKLKVASICKSVQPGELDLPPALIR